MSDTRSISLAAVDLGASSGRVMLGHVTRDSLVLEEARRFRNGPVHLPDGLYWDVLGLYQDVLHGLRDALRTTQVRGVAIDAWAVDYGLLDADRVLRANPRHYRDGRTEKSVDRVHDRMSQAALHQRNGLQFLPFNTVYQLAAEPSLDDVTALLIPDLLGYWLSGTFAAEETNASTTGLLDVRTADWARDIFETLDLPEGLFPDVVAPGQVLGGLSQQARSLIGAASPVILSTVGSHDTASAVLAVPAQTPRFGYISCGTWGLAGVELEQPVLTEAAQAANFTNERGVDGTVRFLRNVMGLWLLSESLRTWALQGRSADLDALLAEAAALPAGGSRFDPDDPVFLAPGDMPDRIARACQQTGRRPPRTQAETVRAIVDTLAHTFARRIDDAEALSGQDVDVIHIVGGGAQNELLCQLLADEAQRPVVAGPVEATALGNIVVQARTHGALPGDRWALRSRVRAAGHLVTYLPTTRSTS